MITLFIGECNNIVSRFNQHNSGYDSKSTMSSHRRPYAVMVYIYGFLIITFSIYALYSYQMDLSDV